MGSDGNPHGGDPDEDSDDPQGDPHGGGNPHGGGGDGRVKMPMQSKGQEDPSLPAGTIAIEVRDGDGKPLPDREIVLGVVENSIAKGESRKRLTATTGPDGKAIFSKLDTASVFAYRVSTVRDGATYAAPPFNLPKALGMRVSLFAYPATAEIKQSSVASQGIVYLELKDEVIQVEQAYRIFNLGSTTWLATGVPVKLPEGFKAFTSQKTMDDLSFEGSADEARFRGGVTPGMHDTAYRFQLAYGNSDSMTLDLGLLPHVQAFRVIIEAPKGLQFEVDGFPPPQAQLNGNGQRILVTEKELPKLDDGFRTVRVRLGNLPSKPQGRWYALALALGALGLGLYGVLRLTADHKADQAELDEAQVKLLDELAELEKARASGEIGPKTYQQARGVLIDSLARVLARSRAADKASAAQSLDQKVSPRKTLDPSYFLHTPWGKLRKGHDPRPVESQLSTACGKLDAGALDPRPAGRTSCGEPVIEPPPGGPGRQVISGSSPGHPGADVHGSKPPEASLWITLWSTRG
jgi:hypothetical protein